MSFLGEISFLGGTVSFLTGKTSFLIGNESFLTVRVSFFPSYFVFSGCSAGFFMGFCRGATVVFGAVVGFLTN